MRVLSAALAAGLLVVGLAGAAVAEPRHGLSPFGDLKYPADFKRFGYVNPDAPKGGTVRLAYGEGAFDNVNPFILKGVRLRGQGGILMLLPFETLMVPANDEADALYGLVAESADVAADKLSVTFTLRPEARWHDGTPITAEDVAFTFDLLKTKGAPSYRLPLRDVTGVEVDGPRKVTYRFDPKAALRDLPLIVAALPILSRAYYGKTEFDRTTFEPPLASGPYRMAEVNPGRSIVFRRVEDHWARNLPVNVGRWNFGEIRLDFYRDRDVEFEAFKGGGYDFRAEFTSKTWATGYDFPAIRDGRVVKEILPDGSPANRQWFVLNLRKAKFADRRVRQAFDLMFDFEWTNTTLFYGLYERSTGLYHNTPMAATALPDAAELELLNPFRDKLPPDIFTQVYAPPKSDGSGNNRAQLLKAARLLDEAGWRIRDGKRRNAQGEILDIEFLEDSPTFERIAAPIVENMRRLGIEARMRTIDAANYANRLQGFDFDVITIAWATGQTPGIAERNYWGTESAKATGGVNYPGVMDPAVDMLVERIANAQDRPSLTTAARALDRVVMGNQYVVTQWTRTEHPIAHWNIFGRPAAKPDFDLGFLDTWWVDAAKVTALARAGRSPQ